MNASAEQVQRLHRRSGIVIVADPSIAMFFSGPWRFLLIRQGDEPGDDIGGFFK